MNACFKLSIVPLFFLALHAQGKGSFVHDSRLQKSNTHTQNFTYILKADHLSLERIDADTKLVFEGGVEIREHGVVIFEAQSVDAHTINAGKNADKNTGTNINLALPKIAWRQDGKPLLFEASSVRMNETHDKTAKNIDIQGDIFLNYMNSFRLDAQKIHAYTNPQATHIDLWGDVASIVLLPSSSDASKLQTQHAQYHLNKETHNATLNLLGNLWASWQTNTNQASAAQKNTLKAGNASIKLHQHELHSLNIWGAPLRIESTDGDQNRTSFSAQNVIFDAMPTEEHAHRTLQGQHFSLEILRQRGVRHALKSDEFTIQETHQDNEERMNIALIGDVSAQSTKQSLDIHAQRLTLRMLHDGFTALELEDPQGAKLSLRPENDVENLTNLEAQSIFWNHNQNQSTILAEKNARLWDQTRNINAHSIFYNQLLGMVRIAPQKEGEAQSIRFEDMNNAQETPQNSMPSNKNDDIEAEIPSMDAQNDGIIHIDIY